MAVFNMTDLVVYIFTIFIVSMKYLIVTFRSILLSIYPAIRDTLIWYVDESSKDTYMGNAIYWFNCSILVLVFYMLVLHFARRIEASENLENDNEDDDDDDDEEIENDHNVTEPQRSTFAARTGSMVGSLAFGLTRNLIEGHKAEMFSNSRTSNSPEPTQYIKSKPPKKQAEFKAPQRKPPPKERNSTPTVNFDSVDIQCRGIFRVGDNYYMTAARRGDNYTTRVHLGHKSNTGRKTGRVFNERYFVEWHRND